MHPRGGRVGWTLTNTTRKSKPHTARSRGAPFIVGLLNPTAFFELALYPLAGRLKGYRKATQRPVRLKLATGGDRDVPCYLFSVDAFARRMSPRFTLQEAAGLHVFLPPP